jgi:hypothetical protein
MMIIFLSFYVKMIYYYKIIFGEVEVSSTSVVYCNELILEIIK